MQRSAKFIAAAALAIGGISFIGSGALADDASSSHQQHQQSTAGQTSGSQSQERQDQSSSFSQGSISKEQVVYGVIAPQKADQSQLPQGFTKTEVSDASSIRQTIGQFTQAALQKGQEQQLLQYLTHKDQQRLQDAFKQQQGGQMDQHLTQLQQAWQQKYGSFDANQFANAFNQQFTVLQGEITQPQLLSNWPVQQPSQQGSSQMRTGQQSQQPGQSGQSSYGQSSQGQSGQTGTSGSITSGSQGGTSGTSNQSGQASSGQSTIGGQASGQQSQQEKQAAVVVFPAEQNIPETYVSMMKEGNSWKIDVPEQLDGQKLRQNLDKHLNEFVQAKDQWPKDVNQAYRIAAHHVMMALYDTGSQSQGSQGQSGQSSQGQGSQNQRGQSSQGQSGSTGSGSSGQSQQR